MNESMNAPDRIFIHHADQIKNDGTQCLVFTSPAPENFTADQTEYVSRSSVPDIIRSMVVPLVFIRHPIGWNCTGFMIDARGSCGGVYVMRGLYGKPRFDSVEDAITACNAHNAAQIMAGLGL
tara:strand:+ start:157 stop:525 length:369 start_codon:yes stop_codon:yes gene_type:complete